VNAKNAIFVNLLNC